MNAALRRWPLARPTFMLVMLAGTVGIAEACLAYIDEGDMHPFILEKLPLTHESVWIAALYVHLAAALVSLPGCIALTSKALLRRAPRVHRWLGRGVGLVVLMALVPSGSYLAFFARGGVLSTLGFLLSGAIVAWGMTAGVSAARSRRYTLHRRCVAHVVAQMSVAVTSRALLAAGGMVGLDGDATYVAALWLPVLLSAAVVEWMFASKTQRSVRGSQSPVRGLRSHHEEVDRALLLDAVR